MLKLEVNKIEPQFNFRATIPTIAITVALLVDILIPNNANAKYRNLTNLRSVLIVGLVLTVILFFVTLFNKSYREKYSHKSWFVGAMITFFNVLNIVTVKFMLLPQIYFPSLNRVLNVFIQDRKLLLTCMGSSFSLFLEGLVVGVIAGIITGIMVGWSKNWNYWVNPLIRMLGPIPSSTWIPLALVIFPTPRWAAIFLIAFGVWFQLTILTSSGIQSVSKSYFEVSSTLGATDSQNLFRIAIPDSLPSIFLGFFNATCSSFVALIAAEMIGSKSGIGWYINWQKEMVAYPNVYAGLLIIAAFCYIFITIQFKIRDKLLGWQKGVIKW